MIALYQHLMIKRGLIIATPNGINSCIKSWLTASTDNMIIKRRKCTKDLPLKETSKKLHGQPLMIQIFLSLGVAFAFLMIK